MAAGRGKRVVAGDNHLDVLELEAGQFRLKPSVQVWMYVSALPVSQSRRGARRQLIGQCGDASTLHTALHQPADMAALKDSPRLTEAAPASGDIAEAAAPVQGLYAVETGTPFSQPYVPSLARRLGPLDQHVLQ